MDSKPVLLVITSTFPRWKGDSEPRFVYDLSIRLADSFDVVVLAPHASGSATYEERDGLRIHRYRYAPANLETLAYEGGITANLKQKPWKWLLLPGFLIGQWLALRKLLKAYSVQAIHAHWLIPQGLVAVLATRWHKQRPTILCTSHGGDLYGLQDKLSVVLKQWVARNCQTITVVSTPMVEKIKTLAGDCPVPVQVIPMGTDLTQTFVSNPNIKRLPNQLLFVGRLVEKKGVKHLLHALKEVCKSLPDTRLVIVGSGPLQASLEKLSKELGLSSQTTFAGRLGHPALVQLYQESTVAVFPFVQAKDGDMEGLGLVMVEAMGCGCPVIASNLPAVRDVIPPESGYLVNSANAEALAERILAAITQPSAHIPPLQQFDWTQVSARYTDILLALLHTSPAAATGQQHLCH